jgi:CelD/BcsL family acetyltransferase involved in cellulose biosynthesis
MVLTRVRNATGVIGCVQLFVERNRLLFYQCGSARVDPKLSPGLITDYLSMQAGLERGYDAYDFLAGDTVHKRKLSTGSRKITWLAWNRPRWKFRAADMLRAVKRRLLARPVVDSVEPR